MQDHLPAKVTLAGCAQYASEYVSDFFTLEGQQGCACMPYSDSCNSPLPSLLVEIMALPSILACVLDGDKTLILLDIRVDPLFFLSTGDFHQER